MTNVALKPQRKHVLNHILYEKKKHVKANHFTENLELKYFSRTVKQQFLKES